MVMERCSKIETGEIANRFFMNDGFALTSSQKPSMGNTASVFQMPVYRSDSDKPESLIRVYPRSPILSSSNTLKKANGSEVRTACGSGRVEGFRNPPAVAGGSDSQQPSTNQRETLESHESKHSAKNRWQNQQQQANTDAACNHAVVFFLKTKTRQMVIIAGFQRSFFHHHRH